MKRLILCLLVTVVLHAHIAFAQTDPQSHTRLQNIDSYVVYYGEGRVDELAQYDLAIIQPETLTDEEIAEVKANDTIVVAYLSIGEVEPYREWYADGRFDEAWSLGENENWGSYFVDANESGWRGLMVAITGEYLERGYDGIFMDTVDTAELFPDTASGMVMLIQQLRDAYPAAVLVQNRGFSILEDTAGLIDAVMFEDLSTSYDFDTDTYIPADNTELAAELAVIHEETGLVVLVLDYAEIGDSETAQHAVDLAREYGFIPFVSTILLDDIPDYGL